MTNKMKGCFMLVCAAFVWGVAFVAQSVGMDYIKPCTFNGIRTLLGFLTLLPVIYFIDKAKKKNGTYTEMPKRDLIKGSIVCGTFLALASTVQTYGLIYTMAGKAGFITAMYMIFVPITAVFFGKKIPKKVFLCVIAALVGMYFLCVKKGESGINRGDILVLISALLFTGHILSVDYYSPRTDGVKLSCFQFLVSGVLNCIVMLIFDKPDWNIVLSCWVTIVYAGVMSCGIGYTFQIIGQKYTEPTVASLIMSLESVFAALAGWAILKEALSLREIFGCLLTFAAIIVVQLPEKRRLKNNE